MNDAKRPDRDFLIEEVEYGRLSPSDAELSAKQFGIDPLASRPNPEDYQPELEPSWTLPMVMAWILWRDMGRVIEFYDPFRIQYLDWQYRKRRIGFAGPVHEGYFLEPRQPATLAKVKFSKWFDEAGAQPAISQSTLIAEKELLRALKEGSLVATGIPSGHEKRQPIPAYDWNDLRVSQERGRDVAKCGSSGVGYSDILLDRRAVMAQWPHLFVGEWPNLLAIEGDQSARHPSASAHQLQFGIYRVQQRRRQLDYRRGRTEAP